MSGRSSCCWPLSRAGTGDWSSPVSTLNLPATLSGHGACPCWGQSLVEIWLGGEGQILRTPPCPPPRPEHLHGEG